MGDGIPFAEFLAGVRPAIDRRIEGVATEDGTLDDDVVRLLLKGKRMRGGLLLCTHETLANGNGRWHQALDLACAVELAHASSLILDDMLDEDTFRRGVGTLHLTRGQKQAMLDTIGVLSLPYALAAPYGAEYVTILASTQRSMASGVTAELASSQHLPAPALYDSVITRKTGHLFSLTAAWGCMAAGQNHSMTNAFARYGLRVGKAMQIADDIADLSLIVSGGKQSGFGSEILLLRRICGDERCTELLQDIRQRHSEPSKLQRLWSAGKVKQALAAILDAEVMRSTESLRQLPEREVFARAAREIVGMVLREEAPRERVSENRV